jgi:hypothetical protein
MQQGEQDVILKEKLQVEMELARVVTFTKE